MKGKPRLGGKTNLKGPRDALGPKNKVAKKPGKSTKSQIRDYHRLLKKAGNDAGLRKSLEAKLEALEREHAQATKSALEQKLARRYHKVKFVERVKIERSIKKLQRAAKQAPGGQLPPPEAARLAQLQEDLQYVLHFPKGEKYVSLLRDASDPAAQAHLAAERARLRAKVKEQLAERALLADIDEGRVTGLPASNITAQAQGVREGSDSDASGSSGGSEESGGESEAESGSSREPAAAVPPRPAQTAPPRKQQQKGARPLSEPTGPSSSREQPAAAPPEPAPASQPFEDDFFLSADADQTAAPLVLPKVEPLGKRKQTPQALAKRPAVAAQRQQAPGGPTAKPRPKAAKPQAAKPRPAPQAEPASQQPKRTRAEGGRKRRKKK